MARWPFVSRVLSGGLFAFAAATLVLGGSPACQLQAATVDQVPCPPNPDGSPGQCQVQLTILHTADIHSRLLPYDLQILQIDGNLGLGTTGSVVNVGGAARLGYVLNRERAKSNRVVHISGGDVFEGAPIFNFFNGEPEMRVQSYLGVDAAVLANHEFDRGANNVVRQIQKWADFPILAANYIFQDPSRPGANDLDSVIHPFTVLNAGGLKIAVIGMGNLSSLTSIFNTPNTFGIHPMNSDEVVQFYVDLLRPLADLIVVDSHLGLDVDQRVITETSGVDVWLGSHNHIVIDPPAQIYDCSADPQNPGFIWVMDPNIVIDPNVPPPNDAKHPDPVNHPYQIQRFCTPRPVLLAHSGAFAKYVGRLDLVLSNVASDVTPTHPINVKLPDGTPVPSYDAKLDSFEVVSSKYQVFPITAEVPEDPAIKQMLEPYEIQLQTIKDFTILAGYSPNGARRVAPAQGDSPLGNLVAASNWLRLGIQTDFSLTNTTGLRQDLLPGPVTIDEAYDIFPFDNTITTMYLSGAEIFQLYDYVARRSSARGCVSQAQIAGSRVRINCTGCSRTVDAQGNINVDTCTTDADCPAIETVGSCNTSGPQLQDRNGNKPGQKPACSPGMSDPSCYTPTFPCNYFACAENAYVGFTTPKLPPNVSSCAVWNPTLGPLPPGCCQTDNDCGLDANKQPQPGSCSPAPNGAPGICMTPVVMTNVYELATSNYLAGGGSGFRVLQRNTTQINSYINQRDAMLDYMRQGKPCGYGDTTTVDGLTACSTDSDCAPSPMHPNLGTGGFVCGCAGNTSPTGSGNTLTCMGGGAASCPLNSDGTKSGRCILQTCRDQVAQFRETRCAGSPDPECAAQISPCDAASETCQLLSCVDDKLNALTDGRINMIGH